jgi:hypothetical protein
VLAPLRTAILDRDLVDLDRVQNPFRCAQNNGGLGGYKSAARAESYKGPTLSSNLDDAPWRFSKHLPIKSVGHTQRRRSRLRPSRGLDTESACYRSRASTKGSRFGPWTLSEPPFVGRGLLPRITKKRAARQIDCELIPDVLFVAPICC